MAAGSEKFCLRWNDFEANISVAFRELREDKDFFDVTLACGEDQIQAHKVILSACSPFFRSILRRNRHEHPLLFMKGVKFTDMVSVLNFMYNGEVNVAQEELNSFLAVAEDLKVKGFTQNKTEKKPTIQKSSIDQHTSLPVNPLAPPRPRTPQQSDPPFKRSRTGQEEVQEVREVEHIVKREPPTTYHPMDTEQEQQYSMQEYGGGGMADHVMAGTISENKELDLLVEGMMISHDRQFVCTVCGKKMRKKAHMMAHAETHVEGVSHQFPICHKLFKTRPSLDKHRRNYHKGEKMLPLPLM